MCDYNYDSTTTAVNNNIDNPKLTTIHYFPTLVFKSLNRKFDL